MSQAVETQQKELAGKYHPYPKYKDSGVEWLEYIPNEWLTIPVGRLFSRIKRTGHSEKELLSVYRDYGVIPKSSRDDNNNKESDDLAPYQLVRPNDLVMNKMKAWQGSIAISEYEGIVSPAYFVYEPNNKLFELAHPRYVHYLLRNPIYITQYMSRSKGIRVNQWDLDPDEFKLIELLLPSKQEQSKIFEFLDYETARIDQLIAKQHRLIELLKEKQQAVISQAVTKGLNPDVPMKDSGVEWLGQVPAHWNLSKLNYLVSTRKGVAFKADDFCDDGVSVVKASDIKGLTIRDSATCLPRAFISAYPKAVLNENDIILSTVGSTPDVKNSAVGQLGRVPPSLSGALLNQNTVVFDLRDSSCANEFLFLLLQTNGYRDHLDLHAHGTANQASLNVSDMLDFMIALPPIDEQLNLSESVKMDLRRLEALEKNCNALQLTLQERRTALISAAVTGKIDLRGWTPPAEEAAV
ncbi:restriction modification system DNA specificity domain-containing protein [Aeromonas caviae]|uniref:restriction endonuclease subunit S n=1 Tax=Aeromonas TaxID=642 RepID=UPI001FB8DF68|nr:restriction endonuclease subunit S [Aeromonas caviae]GKR78676.1 restriction modification system DNA specificity domain-containing protein [Aeromonas caviae]